MKKALVVGIDDYSSSPLTGCVNDANSIANTIESNGDGSPNFGVRLITSPGADVTRSNLREAIEQLFSGESDMALLYFSGHGFIKSTGGYLVTIDANRYDEGVSMDEILNLANQSKAKNKVIILADTAERAEEIDEKRAKEARQKAEESLKDLRQFDSKRFANISSVIAKELARTKAVIRWKKLKR